MNAQRKVLIIDDTLLIRAMAEGVLKQAGFEAKSAADGGEGKEIWAEWNPDVVFLDLTMPGESGWDVLGEMKSKPEGKDTPVYILSGEDDPATAREAVERGAVGFIHKPFTSAQLLEAVTAVIPTS
jgi:two-component system chemotaxis response regulator CheY